MVSTLVEMQGATADVTKPVFFSRILIYISHKVNQS